MTPEEIKAQEEALLLKVKSAAAEKLNEVIENNPSIKGIETLKEQVKLAATKADLETALKAIEEMGLKLKSAVEKPAKDAKPKTFAENIYEGYKTMLEAGKLGDFDSKGNFTAKKFNGFETLEIKSATTMTESNITPVGTSSIPYTLADYEPGITSISRRNPFIIQICNVGRTIKKYVQWVEVANPDGGAGTTSEGSAKTEQDFDLVEKSAAVQKITSYIKVSKEMLDDVEFIKDEINKNLMELVLLKLDTQVLSGDGSAPNLNGIITQAATFAGTPFVNAVDYANRFDVLRAAINQIVRASGGDTNYSANFVPNYIVLHPDDVTAMELTKNTQGLYLLPPFLSDAGKMISGCTIVANTGMTSGTFLVGDFTKANVKMREDAAISIGYENDDFTKNLITILCEVRAVCYIKTNHTKAFSYGVFSSAITSLKDAKS